jgi:hypothetical protein
MRGRGMAEGNVQPNIPVKFAGRNIRTPKRSGSVNDIYLVQFEIDRESWEAMESIPKTSIIEGVLWHHDGDGKTVDEVLAKQKQAKAKPIKGPHSAYWQEMFKAGFHFNRDLHTALQVAEAESVKDAVKNYFSIESLTYLSPNEFEDFLKFANLDSVVTLSRQAAVKAAEGNRVKV